MRTNNGFAHHEVGSYGMGMVERLDAVATALTDADLSELSDAAIEESFSVLSVVLCRVDVLLSRLTVETRVRDHMAAEFPWFGVDPADIMRTDAEIAHLDALPLAG